MNRDRLLNLLLMAALMAAPAAAQIKNTLSSSGEPFSLERGSSFTASGPTHATSGVAADPQRMRLMSEISEAEALISKYHVDGRTIKTSELTREAVDGMLRSLDPHSHFFDRSHWTDLLSEQRSGYTGIGATIANFTDNGVTDTFILATVPGSPADRSHLRFGDRIVAVNGENMTGRISDYVRDAVRGPDGTPVRITIERAAGHRVETIALGRARVPVPSIPDAYMFTKGVGYIDLTGGFTYTTGKEFENAVRELKRTGVTSLVVDLRGNGGGLVDQAVKVAEHFLPAGALILTQRGRTATDNRVWSSANAAPEQMPLVMIVDEETASASEIVAGALQDNDRALIVGTKTFGKGLVQTVIDLPDNTGLTLTTARYLTPSGRSIQRDYSRGDLYDYFKHTAQADAIDRPYFEARTITDRRVYGGDGIKPDDEISRSDLSQLQLSLLDPIFFFAREKVNESVTGHVFRNVGLDRRIDEIEVTDEMIGSLNDFLLRAGKGRVTQEDLSSQSTFIERRLRYNLAVAAYGNVPANQVLMAADPQVLKAIAALPRSAKLSQTAMRLRQKGH